MNFSGVRLDMSFKEAKELDALLARNKAKPAIHDVGENKDLDIKWSFYKCPTCGRILQESDEYCSKCGQKIDRENNAL